MDKGSHGQVQCVNTLPLDGIIKFFNLSIKRYAAGTQKNRLIETVLLSTQNLC